jgi:hypothetical protein
LICMVFTSAAAATQPRRALFFDGIFASHEFHDSVTHLDIDGIGNDTTSGRAQRAHRVELAHRLPSDGFVSGVGGT